MTHHADDYKRHDGTMGVGIDHGYRGMTPTPKLMGPDQDKLIRLDAPSDTDFEWISEWWRFDGGFEVIDGIDEVYIRQSEIPAGYRVQVVMDDACYSLPVKSIKPTVIYSPI